MSRQQWGCVAERKTKGYLNIHFKKLCFKFWICVNEPQSYPKIQYSWNNPNLECFYLVIQVGSTGMTNVLDCRQRLWTGTAGWLLYEGHPGHTKVMKIMKVWHGFKIFPILADLSHIYYYDFSTKPDINFQELLFQVVWIVLFCFQVMLLSFRFSDLIRYYVSFVNSDSYL